ncbi:endonuclease, partial [Vibrio agarivorans]
IKNNEVVFFQEMFRSDNQANVIRTMRKYFPYVSRKLDGGGFNTYDGGVITFSKYPIIKQQQYVFSNCTGTDCLSDKGALYTKIVKGNIPFHLVNLHLGSWNDVVNRNIRLTQVEEVARFIKSLNIPT